MKDDGVVYLWHYGIGYMCFSDYGDDYITSIKYLSPCDEEENIPPPTIYPTMGTLDVIRAHRNRQVTPIGELIKPGDLVQHINAKDFGRGTYFIDDITDSHIVLEGCLVPWSSNPVLRRVA